MREGLLLNEGKANRAECSRSQDSEPHRSPVSGPPITGLGLVSTSCLGYEEAQGSSCVCVCVCVCTGLGGARILRSATCCPSLRQMPGGLQRNGGGEAQSRAGPGPHPREPWIQARGLPPRSYRGVRENPLLTCSQGAGRSPAQREGGTTSPGPAPHPARFGRQTRSPLTQGTGSRCHGAWALLREANPPPTPRLDRVPY